MLTSPGRAVLSQWLQPAHKNALSSVPLSQAHHPAAPRLPKKNQSSVGYAQHKQQITSLVRGPRVAPCGVYLALLRKPTILGRALKATKEKSQWIDIGLSAILLTIKTWAQYADIQEQGVHQMGG